MINGLTAYPEYRYSGTSWLGSLPAGWQRSRIKHVFHERDQRSGDGRGVLLSLTRARGLLPQAEASNRIASVEDLSNYKVCSPGNLVMNRMQAWSGMFATSEFEGLVSPDYSVFFAIGTSDVRYFEHLFKTPLLVDQFAQRSRGVGSGFNRLYTPDFGAIPIPFPPIEDQSAIVRFLDHTDRRIRRYIRAKQKLIKLLEEQKQAIIHRAVTRGLDADERLKPSGVTWLGDVPEHWLIRRLKHLVSPVSGVQMGPFGASLTKLQDYDTGFKLFGQENTIRGDFTRGTRFLTESQFEELRRYELVPGDLVLTRKGSIGKCRMIPPAISKGIADSDTIRVRLNENSVSPRFIVALLHDAPYIQHQIHAVQRGAILGGLNTATIANLSIAVPPLDEQERLLTYLCEETERFTIATTAIVREIRLLQEYRTRLVTDIVTGKLDVRTSAANLHDEPDDGDAGTDANVDVGDEASTGASELGTEMEEVEA